MAVMIGAANAVAPLTTTVCTMQRYAGMLHMLRSVRPSRTGRVEVSNCQTAPALCPRHRHRHRHRCSVEPQDRRVVAHQHDVHSAGESSVGKSSVWAGVGLEHHGLGVHLFRCAQLSNPVQPSRARPKPAGDSSRTKLVKDAWGCEFVLGYKRG